MLLAVEGGGFFSSSATGYIKGLSLLLLGQKNESKDKPMRVLPWNHYELVDEDTEPDHQLASSKPHLSRGCASFVCFGRASAGLDSSPLKVGPTHQQEIGTPAPFPTNGEDGLTLIDDDSSSIKSGLKSSLRKSSISIPIASDNSLECEELCEKFPGDPSENGRRSIQWTDICGGELVEIREFEPSEVGGSDDELNYGNLRPCSCTIM